MGLTAVDHSPQVKKKGGVLTAPPNHPTGRDVVDAPLPSPLCGREQEKLLPMSIGLGFWRGWDTVGRAGSVNGAGWYFQVYVQVLGRKSSTLFVLGRP